MTYSLCLLALAAVFVVRSVRVRARRKREREQAQLESSEGMPATESAGDGLPLHGRPYRGRSDSASVTFVSLLPIAVTAIDSLRNAGVHAVTA